MAKSKRSKKSKEQIMSETLRLRVTMLLIVFVVVIAALRLGLVGQFIHYIISFLFGNLYGVIYGTIIILSFYIIYKAKLPRFNGPEAIGLYLIYVSVSLLATIPNDSQIKGIGMINTYIQGHVFNKGGFIGTLLFGIFSTFFDSLGTIIFAIVILVIGCTLLFSKIYVKYQAKEKKKVKKVKEEKQEDNNHVQTIILKKKSHFFDFFSKSDDIIIFPDEVFDDFDKDDEPLDSEITSAFEFNDQKMKIDIKEMEPVKEKEIVEETVEVKPILKNKNHLTHYQLPPLTLLSTKSTNNSAKERNSANKNAARLTSVLKQFGVNATIENAFIGPTITKYELKLDTGTRVNKILQLQDDIKLALATADIRIEAPIPGKPYVGIEIGRAHV